MKSKICSSEYVRTVSRGKSWIPAFLSLGFFLAFPVALLLVVGNWKAARYTPDQLHLLYEGLWKEKLVSRIPFVTSRSFRKDSFCA